MASRPPRSGPTRRQILKYGLAGAAALGAGGALWTLGGRKLLGGGSRRHPNVIVVIVDTLRADHLGCYGSPRAGVSPHIDALARDACVFRRAISVAPWTLPSIASLLTSQYPSVLGIREGVAVIDPTYPLLPSVLAQYGYRTHGIVSADMLAGVLGFARGFERYDDQNYFGREGVTSPVVFRKAIDFLRTAPAEPFFLLVHTFDPHYNYIEHRGHDFAPTYHGHLQSNQPITDIWRELPSLTDEDIAYLRALYDSEIAFTDEYVGQFLDELRTRGLYDDSLIVLIADHGEEFREHGWIGHTIHLYDELLHVPLIVKAPGVAPGVVDEPVGLIDLAPTILAQLGLDAPANLEGTAIPLHSGSRIVPRPLFSETFHQQLARPDTQAPIALMAVQAGGRKLIVDGLTGARQVYDLASDPGEQHDLMRADPDHREPALDAEFQRIVGSINRKRAGRPNADGLQKLTPEQRARLHSLGYI